MSLTKKNIINNLKKNSSLSTAEASNILTSFLSLIIAKSKFKIVKISSFGTFGVKKTPKRVGRNPKTLDSYIIPELNKLNFKPSNKVKKQLN